MPLADDALAEDHRSDILKELDTFNTAPEFGMMGILQEQMQEKEDAPVKEEEKEEPKPEIKEPDYEKAYAPLNTSIQELGYRMDTRVADLERKLSEAQQVSQQQYQPPTQQYDPEAPVTMAQLVALQNDIQQNGRQAQEAQMRAEYLRAHLEYERFKTRNPDFNVTPQDLDVSFQRFMSNDLNKARNTNWTGHFAQIYEQTAQPRMKGRIAELEKQVEELTKKASRSTSEPSQSISPATGSARPATARAVVSAPTQNTSEIDIVNLPSFRKGKSFKSFANDIKRHYGIRNNA